MARICLITPYHISFQPRTLREADTLSEEGHDVRVVTLESDPGLIPYDRQVMATREWRFETVNLAKEGGTRNDWLFESAFSRLSLWLFKKGCHTEGVGARGYVKAFDRLLDLAEAEEADWFIAHTQRALPLAARAARHWGSRLGFDCEDLLTERGTDPSEIVRLIERNHIFQCDYVSVPSEQVGNRLVRDHRIPNPVVLYNTFPLRLAEGLLAPAERPRRPVVRLHWFGQTLGPGRGLEEAIEALGVLNQPAEFHLRGRCSGSYWSKIYSLARNQAPSLELVLHPLVDHDRLILLLGPYDIGLALERPENPSLAETVSNKLFSYLVGGLAVTATDTPGQREILEKIPGAGFLYPAGKPRALAEALSGWFNNREALREAQQCAWEASRERFCWDFEKQKFLALFAAEAREPHKQSTPVAV